MELETRLEEFFTFNSDSSSSVFNLWCTHKAFIRDLLIQMASRERKKRNLHINTLFAEIAILENQHKKSPLNTLLARLTLLREDLREDLRPALITEHNRYIKGLKLAAYSQNNRTGKRMAWQLKQKRAKERITQLQHHTTGKIALNPSDIAQTFRDYYALLYNLKEDCFTPQPNAEVISNFLKKINLPVLDETSLNHLNHPIEKQEILNIIKSLPLGKSPGMLFLV